MHSARTSHADTRVDAKHTPSGTSEHWIRSRYIGNECIPLVFVNSFMQTVDEIKLNFSSAVGRVSPDGIGASPSDVRRHHPDK